MAAGSRGEQVKQMLSGGQRLYRGAVTDDRGWRERIRGASRDKGEHKKDKKHYT